MKTRKIFLLAGLAAINSFAFNNATWVQISTIKCIRVNGTQALFKINETSPTMIPVTDTKMNTYWFQVDLSSKEGSAAYTALLMAKFSGSTVQFYVPSGTANAGGVYPVQNFTYGQDA